MLDLKKLSNTLYAWLNFFFFFQVHVGLALASRADSKTRRIICVNELKLNRRFKSVLTKCRKCDFHLVSNYAIER